MSLRRQESDQTIDLENPVLRRRPRHREEKSNHVLLCMTLVGIVVALSLMVIGAFLMFKQRNREPTRPRPGYMPPRPPVQPVQRAAQNPKKKPKRLSEDEFWKALANRE